PWRRRRAPACGRLAGASPSAGAALPAGGGDLAGDRECMLEGPARRVDASLAQVDEREQRLWQGSEREPLLLLDELQGAFQGLARLLAAGGQHVHAARKRQGPGRLPPVLAPARSLDRVVERLERLLVAGRVREAHPAHARDRRQLFVEPRR